MLTKEQKLELIDAVANRLREPEHWCKNTMARTSNGDITHPLNSDADRWCLSGALVKEVNIREGESAAEGTTMNSIALDWLRFANIGMMSFNDASYTHHASLLKSWEAFRAFVNEDSA